ncbi:MAG: adenosine deaminase family protein [Acidimicrobiia bacterium]
MRPTVLLHDHLDGGLRPTTMVELADAVGYRGLPSHDPEALADHFDQSGAGSLETYLEAFVHAVAVMATPDALHRVGYESIVDLAADGVVHAEIRFAPSLTAAHGLGVEGTLESVCAGLREGAVEAGITWGFIVDALRNQHDSLDVVTRSLSVADPGIVGFDLAGPEADYPPSLHAPALNRAREGGLRLTIHAGEAAGERGPEYMLEAVRLGAERIGHGVEIIRDCVVADGRITDLGPIASMILDRQIVLETCPTSNAATGSIALDDHPLPMLYEAGFAVTINTDNRLMSRTTMSREIAAVTDVLGMSSQSIDHMMSIARSAVFSRL